MGILDKLPESSDVNNMAPTSKQLLDPEYMKKYYSEEAYFGDDNVFKMDLIRYCKQLRENLVELCDFKWEDDDHTKVLFEKKMKTRDSTKVRSTLKNIENLACRHFNIEKCYIGIVPGYEFATYPIIYDPSIITKVDKDGKVNMKSFEKKSNIIKDLEKFNEIIVDKTGYHYKDKKGKVMVIIAGISMMMNDKYPVRDEGVAALFAHEFGHNFQQILNDAATVMVDNHFRNYISTMNIISGLFMLLNPFMAIGMAMGGSLVMKNNYNLSPKQKNELAISILKGMIYVEDGKLVGRDAAGKELLDSLDDSVEIQNKNMDPKMIPVFVNCLKFVVRTLYHVLYLSCAPASVIFGAIRHAGLRMLVSDKVEKNLQYEQFADTFATAYGLGSDLAEVMRHHQTLRTKVMHKNSWFGSGTSSLFTLFPVFGPILSFSKHMEQNNGLAYAGYDNDKKRIVNQYQAIKYEIDHNKELTSEDKDNLNRQLSLIEESYNAYLNDIGLGDIWYKIYSKVAKGDISKIELDKTIEENVFKVLEEKLDKASSGELDYKEYEPKDDKKFKFLSNASKSFKFNDSFLTPVMELFSKFSK